METKKNSLLSILASSLFLLICCFLLFKVAIYFRDTKFFVVSSKSMSPTLNVGDVVAVTPKENYQTGDIITFELNGIIITHKIVEIESSSEGNIFICSGLAGGGEQKIKKSQILGKATKTNKFLQVLCTNNAPLLLICAAALIFVIWQRQR